MLCLHFTSSTLEYGKGIQLRSCPGHFAINYTLFLNVVLCCAQRQLLVYFIPSWLYAYLLSDVNECAGGMNSTCQNGGMCVNNPGSFTCQCPRNWTGADCSQGKSRYTLNNVCKKSLSISSLYQQFHHIRKNLGCLESVVTRKFSKYSEKNLLVLLSYVRLACVCVRLNIDVSYLFSEKFTRAQNTSKQLLLEYALLASNRRWKKNEH